jgi:ribosome-binding factor A
MSIARGKKISEEIKKIVSHIMMFEIKDPRVSKLSSITHVEVTNDLRFVTIYISVFDPKHNVDVHIEGLNSAKGFIRKEIGKKLKLHFTPEPIFKADDSIEHGMHINEILNTLDIKHDEKPVDEDEDDDDDFEDEDEDEDEEDEDESDDDSDDESDELDKDEA